MFNSLGGASDLYKVWKSAILPVSNNKVTEGFIKK